MIQPLERRRFEALAGYTRLPIVVRLIQEFAWFSSSDERVLGLLSWDRQDHDFAWVVLARDERLQFRAVDMDASLPSAAIAEARLISKMEEIARKPDTTFHQGDDGRPEVDFFTPHKPSKRLHPSFQLLIEDERYSPARDLIAAMMRYHDDVDGNFVEQFQTAGFDARLWELYLYATFVELGFARELTVDVPDFVLTSFRGRLGIEATSVSPPEGAAVPPLETPEEITAYLQGYVPIRLGKALRKKLNRSPPYWGLPHMTGLPFMLALQDFHMPGAMVRITPCATEYVFGVRHSVVDGARRIERIRGHRFGKKSERSGFFGLPGSENVSAVLINPQGTLTKFNRLGLMAGFGSRRVRMVRTGLERNEQRPGDPRPTAYRHVVGSADYSETWVEGMVVLHNPNALNPLDPSLLPGANHEFLEPDGRIMSLIPEFHPYTSQTEITLDGGAR